jgi:hypothetical protein
VNVILWQLVAFLPDSGPPIATDRKQHLASFCTEHQLESRVAKVSYICTCRSREDVWGESSGCFMSLWELNTRLGWPIAGSHDGMGNGGTAPRILQLSELSCKRT